MRGRITEEHLELAEATFPGIAEMYAALPVKPSTFLQLVWLYEEAIQEEIERLMHARRGSLQPS